MKSWINPQGSYHQIELDKESRKITGFITPKEYINQKDQFMEQVQPSKVFNA